MRDKLLPFFVPIGAILSGNDSVQTTPELFLQSMHNAKTKGVNLFRRPFIIAWISLFYCRQRWLDWENPARRWLDRVAMSPPSNWNWLEAHTRVSWLVDSPEWRCMIGRGLWCFIRVLHFSLYARVQCGVYRPRLSLSSLVSLAGYQQALWLVSH